MANIKINTMKCKGCGLCIAACPFGVLAVDEISVTPNGAHPAKVVNPNSCTLCGCCFITCPDLAVEKEEN